MTLPFALPPLVSGGPNPEWTGAGFCVGSQNTPVLEYSENFRGWSDELTDLHEDALAGSHPVERASMADALRQIGRHAPGPAPTILEVGCSSGFLLEGLASAFPNSLIMGADVVREPLFRLAKRLPGVPIFRFDLLQCPLPDACVDAVAMLNVLEHIEHDVAALEQVWRILRPGGAVVLEVPAGPMLYDDYDRALLHFRRYGAGELRRKLMAAGFEVLRMSHLGSLVFPGFALVKLFSRARARRNRLDGRELVRAQATASAASGLVRAAFALESWLGRAVNYPFGIRCLAVGRRPR